ncbi:flagellar motor switch protein FliN [Algisphaera agarilytica]|uniref:Flagellar motor switch protein FliN n=1 Tax=Algisphaera agarilytica TaxID=1385975 RepID=A0A7X0HAC9_9BACT|nr:flagellar motor switch protein FliN [Algisphaera agarilytica]MBB6430750.1 flagellar motor switch protein FliN/FliY [Algisphaera agarilytica]
MAEEAQPEVADDEFISQMLAEAQSSVDEITAAVGGGPVPDTDRGIDLLGDVDLDVSIELGRTEMLVEDVLKLQSGSVVELDKLAGDPVDVYVNGRIVARGEVLVLNDNFCIRVSEILADLEEQAEVVKQEQQDAAEQADEQNAEQETPEAMNAEANSDG